MQGPLHARFCYILRRTNNKHKKRHDKCLNKKPAEHDSQIVPKESLDVGELSEEMRRASHVVCMVATLKQVGGAKISGFRNLCVRLFLSLVAVILGVCCALTKVFVSLMGKTRFFMSCSL